MSSHKCHPCVPRWPKPVEIGEIRRNQNSFRNFFNLHLWSIDSVDSSWYHLGLHWSYMVITSINIVCFPIVFLVWCRLPLCGTTTCYAPAALRHLAKCHQQPTSGHKNAGHAKCSLQRQWQNAIGQHIPYSLSVVCIWLVTKKCESRTSAPVFHVSMNSMKFNEDMTKNLPKNITETKWIIVKQPFLSIYISSVFWGRCLLTSAFLCNKQRASDQALRLLVAEAAFSHRLIWVQESFRCLQYVCIICICSSHPIIIS